MTNPILQRKQSDWSIKDKIRSDCCRGKFALRGERESGGGGGGGGEGGGGGGG